MRVPWWLWALAAALLAAGLLSPLASSLPDGLESVIERHSIPVVGTGQPAPLPDYQTPGVRSERLGVFIAAAVGTIVVAAVALLIGHLLGRAASRRPPPPGSPENHASPM